MKIIWSDRSLKDLDQIFNFYSKLASFGVAQKIVTQLVEKAQILIPYPEIGNLEKFNKPQPFEYRYLVEGNHKLIYRISLDENYILIARAFDSRRNPKKKKP
jgi:plasmid stabilization system protein ParE